MHDPSLACVARGCSGGVSFATCSADGTIRLWDLTLQSNLVEDDADQQFLKAKQMGGTRLGKFPRLQCPSHFFKNVYAQMHEQC